MIAVLSGELVYYFLIKDICQIVEGKQKRESQMCLADAYLNYMTNISARYTHADKQ